MIAVVTATGLLPLLLVGGCHSVQNIIAVDESTEIRIGQQAAADLEAQYGVLNDPVQTARVQRIGRAIAAASTRPQLPWTFRILNTTSVNALALPGGPIYVTRGLLDLGISDSELAGVLGHEVAHVQNRDSVQAIERSMTYQLLAALVFGNDNSALRTAASLAVEYAVRLPRSREAEHAADALGIRLAFNAGYPADGLLLFLERLQALQGTPRAPEWLSTHPLTSERIARVQEDVAQVASSPRPVPVAVFEEEEGGAAVDVEQSP